MVKPVDIKEAKRDSRRKESDAADGLAVISSVKKAASDGPSWEEKCKSTREQAKKSNDIRLIYDNHVKKALLSGQEEEFKAALSLYKPLQTKGPEWSGSFKDNLHLLENERWLIGKLPEKRRDLDEPYDFLLKGGLSKEGKPDLKKNAKLEGFEYILRLNCCMTFSMRQVLAMRRLMRPTELAIYQFEPRVPVLEMKSRQWYCLFWFAHLLCHESEEQIRERIHLSSLAFDLTKGKDVNSMQALVYIAALSRTVERGMVNDLKKAAEEKRVAEEKLAAAEREKEAAAEREKEAAAEREKEAAAEKEKEREVEEEKEREVEEEDAVTEDYELAKPGRLKSRKMTDFLKRKSVPVEEVKATYDVLLPREMSKYAFPPDIPVRSMNEAQKRCFRNFRAKLKYEAGPLCRYKPDRPNLDVLNKLMQERSERLYGVETDDSSETSEARATVGQKPIETPPNRAPMGQNKRRAERSDSDAGKASDANDANDAWSEASFETRQSNKRRKVDGGKCGPEARKEFRSHLRACRKAFVDRDVARCDLCMFVLCQNCAARPAFRDNSLCVVCRNESFAGVVSEEVFLFVRNAGIAPSRLSKRTHFVTYQFEKEKNWATDMLFLDHDRRFAVFLDIDFAPGSPPSAAQEFERMQRIVGDFPAYTVLFVRYAPDFFRTQEGDVCKDTGNFVQRWSKLYIVKVLKRIFDRPLDVGEAGFGGHFINFPLSREVAITAEFCNRLAVSASSLKFSWSHAPVPN
jgi:hypothetical protein